MKVKTECLKAGLRLNDDVIIDNSTKYKLEKDHVLTKRDIVRIKRNNIKEVDVLISNETDTFNIYFNSLVKNTLSSLDIVSYESLANLYKEIENKEPELKYDVRKYYDKNNYNHLANLVNLSVIIAHYYNITTSGNDLIDIESIALAAMLTDIGTTLKNPLLLKNIKEKYSNLVKLLSVKYENITKDILNKYDIKYHQVYSYLISNNYNLDEDIEIAILYHHLKYDKKDSLLGTKFSDLDETNLGVIMSEIIALADIYDLLLKSDIEKNPDKPFANLDLKLNKLVSDGIIKEELMKLLIDNVPVYQKGMKVVLSDGTTALVNSNEINKIAKPVVTDFNGVLVDLRKEKIEVSKHYLD